MIGRGVEAAERAAYPGKTQDIRAKALSGMLRALEARRDGFRDPSTYNLTPEQKQGRMIQTGIEMALQAAEPGSRQERDAVLLRTIFDGFTEDGGFRDPIPMIRQVRLPDGREESYESELTRVSKLRNDDIRIIAGIIGADIVPAPPMTAEEKRISFFYRQLNLRCTLVQKATGTRIDVENEGIKLHMPDPRNRKYPQTHVHLVERGYREVIFWGRGYLGSRKYHEWATQTRFDSKGHSDLQVMDYKDVPPAITNAFGPFDYA